MYIIYIHIYTDIIYTYIYTQIYFYIYIIDIFMYIYIYICSSPLIFLKHLENLKTWFCNRGYPQKVVDAQIKRVSEKSLDDLL